MHVLSRGPETLVRPPRLRAGDRVGIITPSVPSAAWYPARFAHALDGLRNTLGVVPVLLDQTTTATGFCAGDAAFRAAAFRTFLLDPTIRAVFTTIGGFNSNEMLEQLTPSDLCGPAKILCGYSDTTALLLGMQALTGWCVFYGPAVMTQFGEYPCPHDYTIEWLKRVLMDPCEHLQLDDPTEWTNEFLEWGGEEWLTRPRALTANATREVWREGDGEGQLFGGNLDTMNFLAGTPFLSVPEDIVFFWEACDEEAHLGRVQRALTQLRQLGVFTRTRAMLIGRSPDCRPLRGTQLRDVVLSAAAGHDFPIVAELPFGHTDPMLTLPIGVPTRVSARAKGARIELLTAAVT